MKLGVTILMITHDSQVANAAQRVVFLKDGRIYSEMKTNGKQSAGEIAEKMLEVQVSVKRLVGYGRLYCFFVVLNRGHFRA